MNRLMGRSAPITLALITLALFCSAAAEADPLPGQERESRVLSDRLNVRLGWYQPDFSTNLAAGFGGVLGAFINVERTLGLQEDLGVFSFGGFYRLKPKHAIDWGYNVLNRDGVNTIDETITFGDDDPPLEFSVGAEVDSTFNSTLFMVNYKYSFINDGKVEAGISAGLFTYSYDIELVGTASIAGSPGSTVGIEQADTRVIAPLPAFGIFINYAVRHNLIFRADVRALNIEIGDFTGKFSDTLFTLDWYFYKHVGLGLGTSRTSIDFQDKGSDPFLVDYSYGGYQIYVSIVF